MTLLAPTPGGASGGGFAVNGTWHDHMRTQHSIGKRCKHMLRNCGVPMLGSNGLHITGQPEGAGYSCVLKEVYKFDMCHFAHSDSPTKRYHTRDLPLQHAASVGLLWSSFPQQATNTYNRALATANTERSSELHCSAMS